jgi:20S proteasome alpha/beta subunit
LPNTACGGRLEGDETTTSEPEEAMTLCIAAECWHEEKPCIAMCCDTRAERGGLFHELVGSDDVEKIRQIGPFTALLSGSETAADELLTLCNRPIRNFSRTPASPAESDEVITDFLKQLRQRAAERKKDLIDHHLRMSLGLSFEEFLNTHRNKLHDVHARDIWNQIEHIDLETDLLICGFSGDEAVVIRLDRFGKTHWETNYSVVGIGSDIALAFLCQRDWNEGEGKRLQLMDCLFRIYEAKKAAEKNRHVGGCHFVRDPIPGWRQI